MKKLVIMAAGLGSRFGGLKQLEGLGPNGEIILEYSIYDAIKANFHEVIFIIKKENLELFQEKVGKKVSEFIKVSYVFQDLKDIPQNIKVPQDRVKPWGTGHAILSCKDYIDTPFVVINADDFYGRNSFFKMGKFLEENRDENLYSMVGFPLENTLSKIGTVTRGICKTTEKGELLSVEEKLNIKKEGNSVISSNNRGNEKIENSSLCSMNMWGFYPNIFDYLEEEFTKFLSNSENLDNLKSEFLIPEVVDILIKKEKIKVKVLPTTSHWIGVTYKEDSENVKELLEKEKDYFI